MLPEEHHPDGAPCDGCGIPLKYEVLESAAGYYIGTGCNNQNCECFGPNSRETAYYKTEFDANEDLKYYQETGNFKNSRI